MLIFNNPPDIPRRDISGRVNLTGRVVGRRGGPEKGIFLYGRVVPCRVCV